MRKVRIQIAIFSIDENSRGTCGTAQAYRVEKGNVVSLLGGVSRDWNARNRITNSAEAAAVEIGRDMDAIYGKGAWETVPVEDPCLDVDTETTPND